MIAPNTLATDKASLRERTLALRDALSPQERQAAAEVIAKRDLPIDVKPGMIVGGFMPMKSEINPIPLMKKFVEAGAQLALPCIAGRGKPLIMRAWKTGDAFKSGQWGIREPLPEAAEVAPDALIVPLACFDRSGHRIGYGAGYYDMTIAALRTRKNIAAIGIAFSMQEIDSVPFDGHDERLDFVLTEKVIVFGK